MKKSPRKNRLFRGDYHIISAFLAQSAEVCLFGRVKNSTLTLLKIAFSITFSNFALAVGLYTRVYKEKAKDSA